MSKIKNKTLCIVTSEFIKNLLLKHAVQEKRSMINMIEQMIMFYDEEKKNESRYRRII